MKKFLEEFKQFAMRGNVVDLAIAVVVGGAFGKIVTSLTNDIIMPVTGGIDFGDLRWTLKESVNDAPAVTVQYGFFINSIITFLIVAFVIFIVMKAMNEIQRQKDLVLAKTLKKAQKEEEKIEEAKLSKQEELLTEIRDLLSKK